jgi:hypothetical protein
MKKIEGYKSSTDIYLPNTNSTVNHTARKLNLITLQKDTSGVSQKIYKNLYAANYDYYDDDGFIFS